MRVTYVLQDVNDNIPSFERETYDISIKESLRPMSPIFQFGQLMLSVSVDAELKNTYNLIVSATDTGEPANTGRANVVISVLDVNEVAVLRIIQPFHHIPENEIISVVAIIVIEDDDSESMNNQNNTIRLIDYGGMFEISEVYLNVFSLAQTQSFDHETETTIQIQLASTEIGDPVIMQTFTINLTVTDVNDNPPVLSTTT